MNRLNIIFGLIIVVLLSSCGLKREDRAEYEYPKSRDDLRREEIGKIQDDGGIMDYFVDKGKRSKGAALGVNSYLWRAALDTISFMPLSSTDPFGGVIITDWYEDENARGERYKITIVIMSSNLQPDGVKVSVFKQLYDSRSGFRDVKVSDKMARDLEDTILTRARELKINNVY